MAYTDTPYETIDDISRAYTSPEVPLEKTVADLSARAPDPNQRRQGDVTSIESPLATGIVLEQLKSLLQAKTTEMALREDVNVVPPTVVEQQAEGIRQLMGGNVPPNTGLPATTTPEISKAANIGVINNQAMRQQQMAMSNLGKKPGVSGLPANNIQGMPPGGITPSPRATGAHGGLVSFNNGGRVKEIIQNFVRNRGDRGVSKEDINSILNLMRSKGFSQNDIATVLTETGFDGGRSKVAARYPDSAAATEPWAFNDGGLSSLIKHGLTDPTKYDLSKMSPSGAEAVEDAIIDQQIADAIPGSLEHKMLLRRKAKREGEDVDQYSSAAAEQALTTQYTPSGRIQTMEEQLEERRKERLARNSAATEEGVATEEGGEKGEKSDFESDLQSALAKEDIEALFANVDSVGTGKDDVDSEVESILGEAVDPTNVEDFENMRLSESESESRESTPRENYLDLVYGPEEEVIDEKTGEVVLDADGNPKLKRQRGIYQEIESANKSLDKELAKSLRARQVKFLGLEFDPRLMSQISAGMAGKKSFAEAISGGGVAAAKFNEEQKQLEREFAKAKRDRTAAILDKQLEIAGRLYSEDSAEYRFVREQQLNIQKYGLELAKAKDLIQIHLKDLKLKFAKLKVDESLKREINDISRQANLIDALYKRNASMNDIQGNISALMGNVTKALTNIADEAGKAKLTEPEQYRKLLDTSRDLEELIGYLTSSALDIYRPKP